MEDAELVPKIGKSEGACSDKKDDVLDLGSISFEVLKRNICGLSDFCCCCCYTFQAPMGQQLKMSIT